MKPEQRLLHQAADLIERTDFTRGACARDRCGVPVKATAPEAVCFCVSGAARAVADYPDDSDGHPNEEVYLAAMTRFAAHVGVERVKQWADAQPWSTRHVVETMRAAAG